jgi:hypothetical protein
MMEIILDTRHPHYEFNTDPLHKEYISLRWYSVLELVVPIRISLIEVCANKEATEVPIG